MIIIAVCIMKIHFIYFPCKNPAEVEADNFSNIDEISSSDSLKPPVIAVGSQPCIRSQYKYAKKTRFLHHNQAGGSATLAWSSVGWQAEVYFEILDHHGLRTTILLTAYAH